MITMNRLMIALVAMVFIPSLGTAIHSSQEAPQDAAATFLPGADLGVSQYAMWSTNGPATGLVLIGVPGGRLVVDDAILVRIEQTMIDVRVFGEHVPDAQVQNFTLEFRRGDTVLGLLDLTHEEPSVDLGPARAGEALAVRAILTFAPDTPMATQILTQLRAETLVLPEDAS